MHFLSGLLFAKERCCLHSPALHPGAHYNLWDRAGSAEAERLMQDKERNGRVAIPPELMRKTAGLVVFLQLLAFAPCLCGAQSNKKAQELPRLAVDSFSGAMREQVQEAYDYARTHPKEAKASGVLGMILHTYSLLREAIKYYQYASDLAPDEFRWIYYLGLVEAQQGQCEQAASNLPSRSAYRSRLRSRKIAPRELVLASADWEGSQQLYNEVVKQDPDNPDAHYGLGRIHASRHDYVAAAQAYNEALAEFPAFGAAHYALALAYRALGETEKAEEQLRLFEEHKTDAPAANDQLLTEVRALNRSAIFQVQVGIDLERQGKGKNPPRLMKKR